MDDHADHAFLCSVGGDRIHRHNSIRDILAAAAREAALQVSTEPKHLLADSNMKPADFSITDYSDGFAVTAFDVTITALL